MRQKQQQELAQIVHILLEKEVRVCHKCLFGEQCGHQHPHIQDGCIRYYKLDHNGGPPAFFLDFKYDGNKAEILGDPAFSFDFMENEGKDNFEAEIIRRLRT